MARVVKLVSDISGQEAEESAFTKVVVRSHPAVQEAKLLDVLNDEVDQFTGASDLVSLEVGSNGDKRDVVMTLAEFRKLVPDKVVKGAPGNRGRRRGFSPTK